MDEASPHLHIDFVPFYTKGRVNGLETGVSMKAALDEMGFRAKGRKENRLVFWEQSEKKIMDPDINASNYRNIDKVVEPAQEKVRKLADEHRAIRAELKKVTDSLNIIEKASNHTYVDHQLADQRRVAASELLMNGIYSGESL